MPKPPEIVQKPRSPAPQISPVFVWPTPSPTDYLFYVEKDGDLPKNKAWSYGDAYWDPVKYPNHKLVYVSEQSPEAWSRWYYAADRENQDVYNWKIDGDQLIRTYITPRAKYRQKHVDATGLLPEEFTYPDAGTLDEVFTSYGFADDTVVKTDTELDSLYVAINRRYIRPVITELVWNDALNKLVSVTKTLRNPTLTAPVDSNAPGTQVELLDGNKFHKVEVKQEVVLGGSTYPYALPNLPTTINRQFPSLLNSVNLVYAWAHAASAEAAESYSEDYYYDFKITEPRPGPYQATLVRFVTNNPATWQSTNQIDIVPQPVTESIAVVGWWASASNKGNSTTATAKEWSVPATIHPEVTVTDGTDIVGAGPGDPNRVYKTTLAATPGYAAFATLIGTGSADLDYDVKQLPLGLYEVSIVRVDITGLYAP